ncbi:MAG TPA: hypothetical protein VGG73_22120 [Vicinamibacterales bacterium]|jgi:hypothetical protein
MTLRQSLIFTLLTTLLMTACGPEKRQAKGGTPETGVGTVNQARKYLEGRWTLESFEFYPPGKPPVTLKGQGTLSYDDFSNLSMEIRTDVATSDTLRAAGIDVQNGIISTSGRTAVDMQNHTLTYTLEGQPASGTGPLATSRPRYWQVDGNLLTLTTKDDAGKPTSVGKWRKTS